MPKVVSYEYFGVLSTIIPADELEDFSENNQVIRYEAVDDNIDTSVLEPYVYIIDDLEEPGEEEEPEEEEEE